MDKQIIQLFPKTEDAVIVDKHLGARFSNNPLLIIMLKGKEDEVLQLAWEMETEEQAKKK
jgi:hypothetical protein